MIRVLSRWAAKQYYIGSQEFQARIADLHAGLSLRLASEKRTLIEKLNKEADDIEENIKKVDEQLATGYWECENGHEKTIVCNCAAGDGAAIIHTQDCELAKDVTMDGQPVPPVKSVVTCDCGKPMKFIQRDQMTGQEKYESDKERTEAQTIAENKRAQAKAEEENAVGSEKAAKYFQDQAKSNRAIAEKIRTL